MDLDTILKIIFATLSMFGIVVCLSGAIVWIVQCCISRYKKRQHSLEHDVTVQSSSPDTSDEDDDDDDDTVSVTRISVISVPNGVIGPFVVNRQLSSYNSYQGPMDSPPPCYDDIVPRDEVSLVMMRIFDPPSYTTVEMMPQSRQSHSEELPSYSSVVEGRHGCYTNPGAEIDEEQHV